MKVRFIGFCSITLFLCERTLCGNNPSFAFLFANVFEALGGDIFGIYILYVLLSGESGKSLIFFRCS